MNKSKYFVCTMEGGGCRLTDLNLYLQEGQSFEREQSVIETSRSVQAALKANWIREISIAEYRKLNNLTPKRKRRKKSTTAENKPSTDEQNN